MIEALEKPHYKKIWEEVNWKIRHPEAKSLEEALKLERKEPNNLLVAHAYGLGYRTFTSELYDEKNRDNGMARVEQILGRVITLEDILIYPNEDDENEPRVRSVPAGRGDRIIKVQKEAIRQQEQAIQQQQLEQQQSQFEQKMQMDAAQKAEDARREDMNKQLDRENKLQVVQLQGIANEGSYSPDVDTTGLLIEQTKIAQDISKQTFEKVTKNKELILKEKELSLKEKDIDTKLKIAQTNKNKYDSGSKKK